MPSITTADSKSTCLTVLDPSLEPSEMAHGLSTGLNIVRSLIFNKRIIISMFVLFHMGGGFFLTSISDSKLGSLPGDDPMGLET